MSKQENKNTEVKYSEVLKRFVHPMIQEADEIPAIEQKYAFGVHVWNATNIKDSHPQMFDDARAQAVDKASDPVETAALFDELVNYKQKEFSEYKRVIIDFEVLQKVGSDYNITVASAELKK